MDFAMLGVTLANDFCMTEHVQELTTKSAQTVYALCVLRAHGLSDAALQEVYRSVVVARLLYAACAWHGFTKASERQRINTLLDRASQTYRHLKNAARLQMINFLMELFPNFNNVLHTLLPPLFTASQHYNLRRHRTHTHSLPRHDVICMNVYDCVHTHPYTFNNFS